ncbi:AraC family transcriptional regulator [Paraburkholderia gardini]|uniref:HTH-type transcriptional activator RhaS n=1 Tax=Paraburkholderia gardini TaxID=2823469 RepID=A0ABM8TZV1_9BURK|nr:AraC family transcriptional regulator [Paraburkholderia gardini]CAG4890825.1 HTH-type transcriptional activator RhaS [Paraburkholderia gardini]CAG4893033.1 HTH-type transcriptional activator RhaS [Paraburkholderia gardini]
MTSTGSSTRFRDSPRYWRTPLIPGAEMLTAEYYDQAFTPHWHDAYAIPVIEAGAETYRYRGSTHVAEAGSVPVINPGELHTGSRAVDAGWRYRVMYAPVDFLQRIADDLAGRPQPLPWFDPGVIRDRDLAYRLRHAHQLMEAGDDLLAAETAMIDALSTLLARYGSTQPETQRIAANDPRVARMQAQLGADLAAPVQLSDLAGAVGLSPFHAARLFAQATGMPPHAWRNQIRLQRALGPLRAGASVADVAAASGFADQSHFTRHFRRMFGVPPGRWQSA